MVKLQPPDPVKFFAAILWADLTALQRALLLLQERLGPLDYVSVDYRFDVTHYYEPEMGPNLYRRLISFLRLQLPDKLAEYKLLTTALEMCLARDGNRLVNVDIGYLDDNKIVLASCKRAGQKIYLTDGIWADLIARYKQGKYQPMEWGFLDFKDGRYDDDLLKMRALYLEQLRQWRQLGRSQGERCASEGNTDRTQS
ncbi:MAG: DUF4416 family protein [Gemmatales bacterium]|nr:DUF4416 family protein [Gemmatales bacterium]MDW8174042.1 DUF4416 family protein [Gemmatales bacterium]